MYSFKNHPLTSAVCRFIKRNKPDQHYINSYRTEACWFTAKGDVWLNAYYSTKTYNWYILDVKGIENNFGSCTNFRQFKKVILEKIDYIRSKNV